MTLTPELQAKIQAARMVNAIFDRGAISNAERTSIFDIGFRQMGKNNQSVANQVASQSRDRADRFGSARSSGNDLEQVTIGMDVVRERI
ncbi:MAG: hypothetical protein K2Q01_01790, partial [Rickettsiales bacterium]|nr:hypothetical protein [Rickettsiales bacterium]